MKTKHLWDSSHICKRCGWMPLAYRDLEDPMKIVLTGDHYIDVVRARTLMREIRYALDKAEPPCHD